MSLLVYGIVEAASSDPRGVGLDGQSLHAVAEGPLAAVVSDHFGDRVEPTADALSAYEQTVRRLMERGAVLPAQFGSVVEDETAVLELLRRRRKNLVARLQRVRGAVEIGLRASWRDGSRMPSEARSQSGTSYLRDRLELRQSARRVATELDPLGALARLEPTGYRPASRPSSARRLPGRQRPGERVRRAGRAARRSAGRSGARVHGSLAALQLR